MHKEKINERDDDNQLIPLNNQPKGEFTPKGYENLGLLPHVFWHLNSWAQYIADALEKMVQTQIQDNLSLLSFQAKMPLTAKAAAFHTLWSPFFNMHENPGGAATPLPTPLYFESSFHVGFSAFYEAWTQKSVIGVEKMITAKFAQGETYFISGNYQESQTCLLRVEQDLATFHVSFQSIEGYVGTHESVEEVRSMVNMIHVSQNPEPSRLRKALHEIERRSQEEKEIFLAHPDWDSNAEWVAEEQGLEFAVRVVALDAEWPSLSGPSRAVAAGYPTIAKKRVQWQKQWKKWHVDHAKWANAHPLNHPVSCYLCYLLLPLLPLLPCGYPAT